MSIDIRTLRHRLPGAVVGLMGLYFSLGGIWLIALGGSPFYLVGGILLLVSGVEVWRGQLRGAWIYGLYLIATLIWAIGESRLNFWQLEPKLVAPTVIGLWVFSPYVLNSLGPNGNKLQWRGFAVIAVVVLFLGVLAGSRPIGISGVSVSATIPGQVDETVSSDEWRFYGRTPRGDRFSPLTQITRQNVSQLRLVWQTHTGDTMQSGENVGGTDAGHEFNFENTPIKVGDSLYVCTGHSWVEALDAATGRIKWKFDPQADTSPDVYLACRGVSYYEAPAGSSTPCPRRIIAPVLDARLMALNADTGKPCEDFGIHGFVSLTQYLGHVPAGFHFVTSPPLVLKNRVILGGWVYDNQAEDEPSGAVRAFDPMSGSLVWAWDLGRPAAQQVVHPSPDQQLTRGTPNAWGVYTADPTLNMVYLPLGNATPDYYGGNRRPFDDEYASSVVALDITSGEPRWHFQTVHHDLWDFDVPVGPTLLDLPDGHGGSTPALVQSTKRGEFFMLDRRTGAPITAVKERPVPRDGLPGDHIAPTQPYSTGLPSLTPPNLTEASLWGATAFDQLACRIQFRSAAYEGQFTPPHLGTTIVYPAFDGVVDWNGASIDPQRKLLISIANYIPFMITQVKRDSVPPNKVPPWDGRGNEPKIAPGFAPEYGTPYIGMVRPWLNPLRVPCNSPPWGTITAIDLLDHRIVWQHPIGTTRDSGFFGTHNNLPMPTGIFNIGGEMITAGGLIFFGATADDYLRAADELTGAVLWKARLPAGGQANPMSYSVNGKQYVVIAAGGHSGLGTRSGDSLMAYALP